MGIPPFSSPPAIKPIVDTKANILATNPARIRFAYATDTDEFFIASGAAWYVASIKMSIDTGSPDLGWSQESDQQGYGDDYISGKKAYNFALGAFTDSPYAGALRVDHSGSVPTLGLFVRSRWYSIVYDINMDNGELQHVPAAYNIKVRSGGSVETGLNGQPIVQEYQVDLGAYPYPTIIDGGTF